MDYLKIWTSFIEVIEPLNDAERGRLFTAMLEYAKTGEVIEFKGNERYTWPIAKQGIDQAAQKAETLRQNGNKGGRPSKAEETKENQTEPNETKENQTKANESLKDKDNININIKENSLKGVKEKRARFSPPSVEEVAAYCNERKNSVNAQTFVDFYAAKGWKVGQNPMKDWKACVRTWEQRDNYGGTTSQRPRLVRAQDYAQRDYSETDTENDLGVRDLFG